MNWNKKYIFSLLILCAPLLFVGCGSDDDDSDPTTPGPNPPPPPPPTVGLDETETQITQRVVGTTAAGKEWSYKRVTQTGGPDPIEEELKGWSDFKLTLKLGDAVEGKSTITFTATVPPLAQSSHAAVWPNGSGTLTIGTIAADNIGIGRTGDSRFSQGRIETNTAGDEIDIIFTIAPASNQASPNARVGGTPVATWTFELQD